MQELSGAKGSVGFDGAVAELVAELGVEREP
jgi:hypothetical protein